MWQLFSGVGLLMAGHGIQGTLLSVRAEQAGFGSTVTGIVMAMNFVGFMVGTGVGLRAVQRVGHIRVFAALASLGSSVSLLAVVWVNPLAWGVFRFAWGVCFAGLLVVLESWLHDQASNANRGRIMAVYMIVTMGSIAAGHLLNSLTDTTGFVPFVVASVLVSLSLVPMSLTGSAPPAITDPVPLRIGELASIVPTGVVVTFFSGAALGTIGAVVPVYASVEGLSVGRVGMFVAAPMLGSLVLQLPIGRLSDVVPRRSVILGCAAASAAGALAIARLPADNFLTLVVLFAMGGFAYPLYSLAIALSNDWLEPAQRTGASALLVRVNGIGAIVGPVGASLAMGAATSGLFLVLAVDFSLIALYVTYRLIFVRGPDVPSVSDQAEFIAFPARASRVASALVGRRGSRNR